LSHSIKDSQQSTVGSSESQLTVGSPVFSQQSLECILSISIVSEKPLVAVIMGSTSDWDTMCHTVEVLEKFNVPFEKQIVSAHRTPVWMAEFAQSAEERGIEVIVAGAGGAAHLPGMVASHTVLPVLGVPVQSAALQGLDSLLSIVQMPGGIPVGTLAIGKPGAINAGLFAVGILSVTRPELRERLRQFRAEQTARVRQDTLP
jgi:5-(carboxyamino)imidazole ribonucleotide mutase